MKKTIIIERKRYHIVGAGPEAVLYLLPSEAKRLLSYGFVEAV